MNDVYENIDDNNPSRKRKVLIVFDDMIADIMTIKIFHAIIKELFIRYRKLNVSLVFITQSYFSVPKDLRLISTHYLIMKINNKKELQNTAINFVNNIYRECKKQPYSFLTNDTTLSAGDPLKLNQIKRNVTWVEKQLKFLLCHLKILWIIMNT